MSLGFLDGLPGVPDELARALAEPLIDHHVHGCFTGDLDRAAFEESLNEASPDPIPPFMTQFDSQLGFAVRRWCAPRLGLDPHAGADEYWSRRAELGSVGTAKALLPAAGVSEWLVDTGFAADRLCPPDQLATWSGGSASVVLRLESLAESLLADGVPAGRFADAFRDRLAARLPDVVGAKTIAAYRCGFAVDWARPSDAAVARAVDAWAGADSPRLTSAELVAFGVHAAADAGLPIQVHVGLGDRDLDLRRADPLLLTPLLAQPHIARVPVLLLHCYPFHREAGYLAQAFGHVYMDVGLAVNHLGARSVALLAEALELTPFAKQLYSSDACGPPELHLLGAVLWRRGMASVLGRWVADGDWSPADAARVVRMIGAGNAARVYGLAVT
ncbi:MAG TPA: amidohydrolase family protein [Nakamurella sp.]